MRDRVVMALIKKGDIVEIEPIDKIPGCDIKFKVDEVLPDGLLYGCSETCDGFVVPFKWIKHIRILGGCSV